MPKSFDHCMDLVYQSDRDRFLTTLFAPAAARPHLFALYAFNIEIARIRETVSEPLPGEIRLQWWRDFLTNTAPGDAAAHPVAMELGKAIETYDLPVSALTRMIDARVFDLYNDPMPTLNDLEGYAGDTASALFQLSGWILDTHEARAITEAAGHGGVAYAITMLLKALPQHAARHQLFIPGDIIKKHHADPNDIFSGNMTAPLAEVLAELRSLAREHLEAFKATKLPQSARPPFLLLSLTEHYLRLMEKLRPNPFEEPVEIPQWRRQWTLWRASRRS